jgi:hypothetical protein
MGCGGEVVRLYVTLLEAIIADKIDLAVGFEDLPGQERRFFIPAEQAAALSDYCLRYFEE